MSTGNRHTARLWKGVATTVSFALALGSLPLGLTGASPQAQARAPFAAKQLIVAADGMRPDLVTKYATSGDMPNHAKIINEGVTGENGMTPQIAANTGAGWSTLSTGAWPGTHGQMNNTFHTTSNAITSTQTSGLDGSRNQAETYQEVLEKQGKKVAMIEWPGALPTKIKGPVLDYRNFYSGRGVLSNYALPGAVPAAGVAYTSTLGINDATGWAGAPQSFSPAKETSLIFASNAITGTVVTFTFPIYLYDSTNDNAVNYDRALIAAETKDASKKVGDLKAGEWAAVKVTLPQNGLLVGNYVKVIDLNADLSKFRVYYTSLSRIRSNLPDLEQKISVDFPPVTAADFAPIQANLIDAATYAEQGLKWFDSYKLIQDYIVKTYNPDVLMAGYPVTDEFSHQFLALSTPAYTGPRPQGITVAAAEGYIKSAYKQADDSLGNLMTLMGTNTNTFVGADHGFAATWKAVNIGKVLLDAGLQPQEQPGNCRPVTTITTTQAIGCYAGAAANIYVNLVGREPGGVVPAAELNNVRQKVVDAFNNLTDNGTKVTAKVFLREQTRNIQADGHTINYFHPTRTGDVVVLLAPPYQFDAAVPGQAIADAPFFGQHGHMPDTVDLANNTNLHAMFGVHGPNIAKGKKIKSPSSVDFIPTAAYAMGVPGPRFSEGRILTEVFADNSSTLVPIQVLGWSDYHGQLDPVLARVDGNANVLSGGVALIGSYWKEARAKNPNGTIILSDGDNVGATPPNSAFLNDDPTIEAMNALGFTASAMGNHEFDKGVAGLIRLNGIAKFKYLANNIVDERTNQLAAFATPYMTVQANGIEVGIIGVANPETPLVTSPAGVRGFKWVEPLEPTNRYVKELVAKGVKTIIVVYHQGSASGDFDTINGVWASFINGVDREVDLVYGGHTRIQTMTRVNGMLVAAANHALTTSEITLLVDPATKNVAWSWGVFERPFGGAITPDPALAAIAKAANDNVKPILGEQVATSNALVDRSRGAESKMGNLISDAIRATYGTDIALQNSGGLRADFNPGPITKGDVFAVLPFGNLVVTGKLKGSDLLAALENGVSDVSGTAGRFIQLSGLRFAYDASKPVGSRVLYAVLSDGRAVDPAATYTVATNDFMQVGGDNYTSLTRMTEVVSREQLYEVAANYVKSVGTLDPQVEGRIVAAQAGQPAPTPPTAATAVLPTPASILPTAVPATVAVATATAASAATAVPTEPAGGVEPTAMPQPTSGIPGMPTTGADNFPPAWFWPLVLFAAMMLAAGVLVMKRRPTR